MTAIANLGARLLATEIWQEYSSSAAGSGPLLVFTPGPCSCPGCWEGDEEPC